MKKLILFLSFFIICTVTFAQLITPFTVRYSVSQKGGIVMLANTAAGCGTGTTSCGGNNCGTAHNQNPPTGTAVDNDFVATYVDIDGDASTFMSSSDSLDLPLCSQISFAGLYWGAGGATSGDPDGLHWATRTSVKLKVNNGAYSTLTADASFDNTTGYKSYHNFKDITAIVAATGRRGRYTVADMPLLNDNGSTTNRWGGWAIVIVYKNDLENFRNLTVFNGLTNVSSTNPVTDLTVTGFFTPPSGPVTFSLGILAYDGDRGSAAVAPCALTYKGDSLLFNGAGTYRPVSDALHPANDVFNSTISNNAVLTPYRNPSYRNTLGHDANIFNPNNAAKLFIGNSAISATIRQETGGETYITQVVTSAIDVYEPDLRGGLRVVDLNGGGVNPGDTLEYTMVVRNIGSDPSVNTYIVDTLPSNVVFVPGSINVTFGPNAGSKTDITLDDQGEYNNLQRFVKVRVGTGADASTGGVVLNSPAGTDSTQVKFRVTATTDCVVLICDNIINNRFHVFATGQISGNTFDHGSNPDIFDGLGCPIEGTTNTIVAAGSCVPPTASSNSPVCTGNTINLFATSSSVSTYSWAGPGGFTSTSQNPIIANATAAMSGTYTVSITPPGTCTLTATTTVVVNTSPTVTAVSNQTICNGANTTAINFTGSATTFSWTNNTSSIGLAASGTGNIASFTGINASATAVIATITVTPISVAGCNGTAITFTIRVNPTPTVNLVLNQTLCNGANTAAIAFSGAVSGTTFNWTNNAPSIGLAASGAGNIGSFVASNVTANPVVATITVTPTANGCPGTPLTFTITVNPTPTVASVANQTICNGGTTSAINFSGTTAGTVFSWTNSNTSIGLAASGTGNISPFVATNGTGSPVTATITVTTSANGCSGNSITFTITVNPAAPITSSSSVTICSGASVNLVLTSGVSSTYTWIATDNVNTTGESTTLQTGGTINDVITNNSISVQTVTYTVTSTATVGGCIGETQTVTVTVNPFPNTTSTDSATICSGNALNITLTSDTPPSTFTWVATNNPNTTGESTTIQNTSSITDVIINTSAVPQTVVYSVTPTATAGGCQGNTQTVNVVVNPTPTVNTIPDQTLCNGYNTTDVLFTGAAAGTTYSWTNSNTSIGLAASGTGDILSFSAFNTGPGSVTSTITVTPSANGCTGNSITFTITVNPTSDVVNAPDQTLCNGDMTTAVTFNGSVSGTTYSWVNNNTSIGLAASGTGNINPFTAINNGTVPVTATITVTPSANQCGGLPIIFTITVNPTPYANGVADQVVCNGDSTAQSLFSSPVAGTIFSWTNSTTYIGLGASGTGDISSFQTFNGINIPVIATIIVTPVANGCAGPVISFNITVNPTPLMNPVFDQTVCNGQSTVQENFTGSALGAVYNWTNDTPSIGLAASGADSIPAFIGINNTNAPITATITIHPGANSCAGPTTTLTITVNPTPTVTSISNQTLCNGANTTTVTITGPVSGSTFDWTNSDPSIGLAVSGSGDIISFPAVNNGSAPVTATITITPSANGCVGIPSTFTITVNPTPIVDSVSNQQICNGDNTAPINFSGAVAGTLFSWTNTTTSIGIAASGTGNIASFTGINNTSNPVLATITVTPSANGCTGNAFTFTIIVNPTPVAIAQPNQTLCNGSATTGIVFTGPVVGTVFNWTNSDTSIGLGASGAGNIPSFTATNNGSAIVTATITFTPSANGCTGLPITLTITVNPTPTVDTVASQNLCNASTTLPVNFNGNVAGTVYNWTNTNTTIGLAGSGSGNIGAFTATNLTLNPVTGVITVTPTANGCPGNPINFSITVQPTPLVDAIADQAVCNGANTATVIITGSTAGSIYNWTNSNTTIGLAASGVDSVVSFTGINTGSANQTGTITITPSSVGCAGIPLSFTITVYPTPTADSITQQTLCEGSPTTAINFSSPQAGATYTWTNDNPSIGLGASGSGNIGSFIANDTSANSITATITVTPTANGCAGTPVTFTITVNPNPIANAGPVVTMPCNGLATLNGTGSDTGANFTYNWTAAPGNIVSGGTTLSSVANQLGIYTLTITNTTTGCTSSDSTSVIGTMPPLASFTTSPEPATGYVPLNVVFTNTSSNSTTFQWSFGDGSTYNGFDTSHVYTSSGTYIVILSASNNGICPDTAEVTVVVYDDFSLIIPNIFTPNDDGTNDVFGVLCTGVEKLDAVILDRWGLKLYEWHTVNGGWDGHSATGERASEGTYYYIITARDIHEVDHLEKGSFMLVH